MRYNLSQKRYVYWWADGVYSNVRMDDRLCLLVIIGVAEHGHKELVAAVEDGYRESEASWLELLTCLKDRGLDFAPKLAVGDGALGIWKALSKAYPDTRQQRCWAHKTAHVLVIIVLNDLAKCYPLQGLPKLMATRLNLSTCVRHPVL